MGAKLRLFRDETPRDHGRLSVHARRVLFRYTGKLPVRRLAVVFLAVLNASDKRKMLDDRRE